MMRSVGARMLFCAAVAAAVGCAAARTTPRPAPPDRQALLALVSEVQDADYRGDLTRLRSVYHAMAPYTSDPELARAARYWRGFAMWRRALNALNALNDGGSADSVDRDVAASIDEYRAALALDSSYVEAKIGLAAGLGNRAYFARGDTARAFAYVREAASLLRALRQDAPDNPRMLFVYGAQHYWTPPAFGGSREGAIALVEDHLRAGPAGPPPSDLLEPRWGEAELHMIVAFFIANMPQPDLDAAERHARAALAAVPHWHYVRDVLVPQIERQRGAGGEGGA
ncbi:MAG TPA: hypothetical protein VNA89_01760 [Gemmatimonadaceae bacterium]|nr:hypothetical protein [Gemmatimonadaceae bacterium]